MSTAYHPQTDGQSERTNQIIVIALRLLLSSTDASKWVDLLPALQSSHNNSTGTTGRSRNEIVYGFKTNDIPSLLTSRESNKDLDISVIRFVHRREAQNAIIWAASKTKSWYNKHHQPMQMSVDDWTLLRLYRGYYLLGRLSPKLSQHYCRSFQIIERVGELAYRLELPPYYRIYSVISVAQLELSPAPGSDLFARPANQHPESVGVDGDIENWISFEIERLMDRRERRYDRDPITIEYLVKWKRYDNA